MMRAWVVRARLIGSRDPRRAHRMPGQRARRQTVDDDWHTVDDRRLDTLRAGLESTGAAGQIVDEFLAAGADGVEVEHEDVREFTHLERASVRETGQCSRQRSETADAFFETP